uniref:Uncharacterized protein n=1 Tax=Oryza glumipatula TaxID=40148 RepID=A0A0E0A0X5_9ORYZ
MEKAAPVGAAASCPFIPPTLAAEPASVLPSPFFSRILAACSSSRPHLSTTPPSPCVSSNSCRSASLAHGSSFPFPFLSFPVAGATSPSGSGGIPFAIYPSLLPTPAGRTSFSPFIQHFHEVGMTGAAAIRGTTEEKIVTLQEWTTNTPLCNSQERPFSPLHHHSIPPPSTPLLSAASPLSPPTCADVTAASLLFDPPSYADVAPSSSRCSASGARGRASHALARRSVLCPLIPSSSLYVKRSSTEAVRRAAKGVVPRTTLRQPPLDAVITRVVQLRVAEDQASGTSLNNEACLPRVRLSRHALVPAEELRRAPSLPGGRHPRRHEVATTEVEAEAAVRRRAPAIVGQRQPPSVNFLHDADPISPSAASPLSTPPLRGPPLQLAPTSAPAAARHHHSGPCPPPAEGDREKEREKGGRGEEEERERMTCGAHMLVGPIIFYVCE